MMLSRLLLSLFLISGNPLLLADQVSLQFAHDGKTRAYYLPIPLRTFASSDCATSADVRLYAVIGGGHNWPGVANAMNFSIAGRVNLDIHASEVVWSFFDRNYSNP